MPRYRKTYGVRGLLEWNMTLHAGKARIKIAFTGGCMGGNGVIPAKYVTENTAIQDLIERSSYFQNGKIYLHGKPLTMTTHENQGRRAGEESSPTDRGDAELEC